MPCAIDALVHSQQESDDLWYAYAAVGGVRAELAKGDTKEAAERAAIQKFNVMNNGFISDVLGGKVVLE